MLTREEALQRISQSITNEKLVKHMIAVAAIMRGLAEKLGENVSLWEAVGLLHDIDYEEVGNDWNRHGLVSAEMLLNDLPVQGLHAIKAHNPRTGVDADNPLDIALIAADGLSGLVIATTLMMPDKKLNSVKVRSLRRKFKDASFARGVRREDIRRCEKLGLNLDQFFGIGLDSMQRASEDLGL